jgi:hypothetical protein
MTSRHADGANTPEEIEQRLQKILHGAFAGLATSLKDIPKRSSESRSIGKKKPKRHSLARRRKKRATETRSRV